MHGFQKIKHDARIPDNKGENSKIHDPHEITTTQKTTKLTENNSRNQIQRWHRNYSWIDRGSRKSQTKSNVGSEISELWNMLGFSGFAGNLLGFLVFPVSGFLLFFRFGNFLGLLFSGIFCFSVCGIFCFFGFD